MRLRPLNFARDARRRWPRLFVAAGLAVCTLVTVASCPGQGIFRQRSGAPVLPGEIPPRQVAPGPALVPSTLSPGTVQPSVAAPPLPPLPGMQPAPGSPPQIVSARNEGTAVDLATTLTSLLSRGGVPDSIAELVELERQQRKVVARAVACTVSVQIGAAQGCGVIITDTGFVLTAAHVAMRPGLKAIVTLSNGRSVKATTLGMNRNVDAGLMQIDEGQNSGQPWPHATLGTSKNLVSGMWCIATGHPGGYDRARGPVTRIGRILEVRSNAIKTDCALIGGDSGGPMFDISGHLIAVHSRIGNDVAENLHVPIDHYDLSWDRMKSGESWGYLPGFRPVLGVSGSSTLSQAIVEKVVPHSAAAKAGIQPNDIIEEFGNVEITDFDSLRAAVADTMPGERLKVWVNRNGNRIRLRVEIGRDEDE